MVVQADADQRDAEVGRFLTVVARQHAESARIDGERAVQRELGREVCDRPVQQLGVASREPRVVLPREQSEPVQNPIVLVEKCPILGAVLEAVGRDLAQEFHRVVARPFPQPVVDPVEQLTRIELPAPPQVLCDVDQ